MVAGTPRRTSIARGQNEMVSVVTNFVVIIIIIIII